jgi:hypothetical protein
MTNPESTSDRAISVEAREHSSGLAAQLVAEFKRLREAADKAERRAIMFGDLLHHNILAMRAAVVAGHLESHAIGLQWIVNSLDGPGNLPDLDEARALGGAQAMFDKEVAEHEAFREAHPAPPIRAHATEEPTRPDGQEPEGEQQ